MFMGIIAKVMSVAGPSTGTALSPADVCTPRIPQLPENSGYSE